MNIFLVLCMIVLAVAVPLSTEKKLFLSFLRQHRKSYDSTEFPIRFELFKTNLKEIDRLNQEHLKEGFTGRFGITQFSDLSTEEFSLRRKGYKALVSPSETETADIFTDPLPVSFDWRAKGAVTPVKNQGDCGSCWAFSTTEGVESAYFLSGNPLPVLAPQQIVSCAPITCCLGCEGGNVPPALDYVLSAGGMEAEASYPYDPSWLNICHFDKTKVVASLKSWKYATKTMNETAMQGAMMLHGPLSICVDASSWQNYVSGVIKHPCSRSMDHCVQVVGWGVALPSTTSRTGTTDSTSTAHSGEPSTDYPSPTTALTQRPLPYWIVRNSWGTDWGLDGYLWVERGNNECGIAQEAVYGIA